MSWALHTVLLTDGVMPFALGGIQRHSRMLAEHLVRAGARVALYHTAPAGDLAEQAKQLDRSGAMAPRQPSSSSHRVVVRGALRPRLPRVLRPLDGAVPQATFPGFRGLRLRAGIDRDGLRARPEGRRVAVTRRNQCARMRDVAAPHRAQGAAWSATDAAADSARDA